MSRFLVSSLLLLLAIHTGGFAKNALPPDSTFIVHRVPYLYGKDTLEGRLVTRNPVSPGQPLIVLYPDWMGVTDHAVDDAKRLALKGYAVFVADLYGKYSQPKGPEEAGKLAGSLKSDVLRLREVAAAGFAIAKLQTFVDSNRVALLGYCFGGNAALELARSGVPVRGTAVVHGNLKTPFPKDAKNIHGRVLVLHGAADPHVPAAEVKAFRTEMKDAKVNMKFVEYKGALHAFTNPAANSREGGTLYDHHAAESAWGELGRFFAEVLGK